MATVDDRSDPPTDDTDLPVKLLESDDAVIIGLDIGPHRIAIQTPRHAVDRDAFADYLDVRLACALERAVYHESDRLTFTGDVLAGETERTETKYRANIGRETEVPYDGR